MAVKFCVVVVTMYTSLQATTGLVANTGMDRFFRQDYQFYTDQTSFYKLHTELSVWTDAISKCEAEGASLAMPENSAEAEVMVQIMREQLPQELAGVFVGIHNTFIDGTYITVEGTDVSDGWSEWSIDYLNDTSYDLQWNGCGLLLRDGKLAQNLCFLRQAFICKKTLDINPCGTTDTDYFADYTDTKCYKLHQQKMNWTDAYATCFKERAYLAIMNSEQESMVLFNKLESSNGKTITRYHRYNVDIENDMVWLGFHNRFNGEFTTVKGYHLSRSGYTSWEDVPQNEEHIPSTSIKCGMMNRNRKLTSMPCDFTAAFFCERDLYRRVWGQAVAN